MSKIIRMAHAVFRSNTDDVMKEMFREDKKLRRHAGIHLKRKVRQKINKKSISLPGEPPGKVTGNLLKGLATTTNSYNTLVGIKKPAFHALLLEFGAVREGLNVMVKRPFLFPTFAEEAGAVKRILSRPRV